MTGISRTRVIATVLASVVAIPAGLGMQGAAADSQLRFPGVVVTFVDSSRTFDVTDTRCSDGRAYVRFRYKLPRKPVSKTVTILASVVCESRDAEPQKISLANGAGYPDVPGKKPATLYFKACVKAPGKDPCSSLRTYRVPARTAS